MTVGVDNYVYVDNYFVFDRVAVPVGIVAVVDMVLGSSGNSVRYEVRSAFWSYTDGVLWL